jgi:hypothetical protein
MPFPWRENRSRPARIQVNQPYSLGAGIHPKWPKYQSCSALVFRVVMPWANSERGSSVHSSQNLGESKPTTNQIASSGVPAQAFVTDERETKACDDLIELLVTRHITVTAFMIWKFGTHAISLSAITSTHEDTHHPHISPSILSNPCHSRWTPSSTPHVADHVQRRDPEQLRKIGGSNYSVTE